MNEQQLPGESSITTLWIVAVILAITGFCCGFLTSIPALIISIVALRKANKNIKLYYEHPDHYVSRSLSAINTGKVISIITLILSGIVTLFYLLYFLFYGALLGSMLWAGWNADYPENYESDFDDDWNEEIIEDWQEPEDSLEERTWVVDTLKVDSTAY